MAVVGRRLANRRMDGRQFDARRHLLEPVIDCFDGVSVLLLDTLHVLTPRFELLPEFLLDPAVSFSLPFTASVDDALLERAVVEPRHLPSDGVAQPVRRQRQRCVDFGLLAAVGLSPFVAPTFRLLERRRGKVEFGGLSGLEGYRYDLELSRSA